MKKIQAVFISILFLSSCAVQRPEQLINHEDVGRIIKTLSADDMEGRSTFTAGIDRAAQFIENEFKKIGLQPLEGENDFRQEFTVARIRVGSAKVIINGKEIDPEKVLVVSDKSVLNLSNTSGTEVLRIGTGEQFIQKYREISAMKSPVLVLVDAEHAAVFKRVKDNSNRGPIVQNISQNGGAVFILGESEASEFTVSAANEIENLPLFNVAGMIPGKSKQKELVVFSSHYDHLGIIEPLEGDSIANGADDDASGTTAVISLAKYYKELNNNERTLVFVAFTGEEVGGFGARHFSSKLNPDDVIAMFNIEMIGKDSKFGQNSAFITGYEKSDFGQILQKNLEGTDFKFHPDPYPSQNLFYRSDNATLAALGVPAHTISTDQIDTDKFYHTVNDEFETLDVNNIRSTINAIALSARSIVAGTDTPKRIPKLSSSRPDR